jgi:hypothetical protein
MTTAFNSVSIASSRSVLVPRLRPRKALIPQLVEIDHGPLRLSAGRQSRAVASPGALDGTRAQRLSWEVYGAFTGLRQGSGRISPPQFLDRPAVQLG